MKLFENKVEECHIIITVPKTTNWAEYQKEIDACKDGETTMWFKVPVMPKNNVVGKRCYVCYKGKIVGYMIINEIKEKSFTCSTTGKYWGGKFIGRTGEFVELENKPEYKGFQGWRYFKPSEYVATSQNQTSY